METLHMRSAYGCLAAAFAVVVMLDGIVGLPVQLDGGAYGAIHPRLPSVIAARTSGVGCGNWYQPYSQAHKSIRSGEAPAPHKYSVMISVESGLADRLGASITVFLYSLLTNRTFEYMWYGQHELWESYQSLWVDWRVPRHGSSLEAVKASASGSSLGTSDTDATAEQVTENHHWRRPGRSYTSANYYLDQARQEHWQLKNLFTWGDVLSFGSGFDVVLWTLNMGLMNVAFRNPNLIKRFEELGLTWQRAVPCLFNFLYVPSPAALAPFANASLLDTLLDPNNEIVGIQVRLGDWVFERQGAAGTSSQADDMQVMWRSDAHFSCAEQLTAELERRLQSDPNRLGDGGSDGAGRPRRRVFWLLISDSAQLRAAAMRKYGGDGKLLVAEGIPLDHVQDHPFHGQEGLHAAASELWLFGLATAHIVTKNSAFGRLGALAGGPWLRNPGAPMSRVYGIGLGHRSCSLSSPDSLDEVASWWTAIRRTRRREQ